MMKRIASLFVVTFVIINFVSAQEMSNDTKKLYNEAIKAQKTGNFAGAVAKFDEALKIEQNSELYFRKGLALRSANKLDDALISLNKAVELDPKNDQAQFYIATILFSQKNFTDAIVAFEKTVAVTANPKIKELASSNITKCKEQVAYPKVVEANNAFMKKDYKKAIALFTEANAVYERADAYAGLANAYLETKNDDKAIESANKSLALQKDKNNAANFALGMAYKNKGDKEKAKQYFNLCLTDKLFKETAQYQLKELSK